MKGERGSFSGGTATATRSFSSGGIRTEGISSRISAPSMSAGRFTEVPGSRVGSKGFGPFNPQKSAIVNEGPVSGFSSRKLSEFNVNLLPSKNGLVSPARKIENTSVTTSSRAAEQNVKSGPSEVHLSKRREIHHAKLPLGEANRFRPLSFPLTNRKPDLSVRPDIRFIQSVSARPETPAVNLNNDTNQAINTLSDKTSRLAQLSIVNYPVVGPDEVRIQKTSQDLEINKLEQIVADTYMAIGMRPSISLTQNLEPYASPIPPKIIGVGLGERIMVVPTLKRKVNEEEDDQDAEQVKKAELKTQTLNVLKLDKKLALLRKNAQPELKLDNKISTETALVPKTETVVVFENKPKTKTNLLNSAAKKKSEYKFAVDENANKARQKAIENMRAIVTEEGRLHGKLPSWAEVVKRLPVLPTESMTSAIVKGRARHNGESVDGSYPVVKKAFEAMGVIYPKQKPEAILSAIPAVREGDGDAVTDSDVRRVTGADILDIAV